jgi:hypothetical protein
MQKIASSSALIVYYDDLLYLYSTLSAAAEENVALAPLVTKAQITRDEIVSFQDKEKTIHAEVVKKRARTKYFDGSLDSEILKAGMTMEQVVNRDYSHPEYKLFFEKNSASDMVRLGISRENQEVRALLQKMESLPAEHLFRSKHAFLIALKVEKSEKADQEYKQALQAEKTFYAAANLRKDNWNKSRREIYVTLQGLFPHDKNIVDSFFPEIKTSDTEAELPEPPIVS